MILRSLTPVVSLGVLLLVGCAGDDGGRPESRGPVVVMKTTMGSVVLELFPDAAPETVANFIGLAEGTKPWRDPSGQSQTKPFYDGLEFHRVISGFMIQGGCPLGNGMGGPGFAFQDEINAKGLGLGDERVLVDARAGTINPRVDGLYNLGNPRTRMNFQREIVMPLLQKLGIPPEEAQARATEWQPKLESLTLMEAYENRGYEYDDSLAPEEPKRGVLAMANTGPGTNGSQFFINVDDTPHLAGRHTVFGKVIEGMDVVDRIAAVPVGSGSKPREPVRILSIRVRE